MKFSHALPSLYNGETKCGSYNNPEFEYPGFLNSTSPDLGRFMEALRDTVRNERRMLVLDGKVLVCCNNWIRDCTYMFEAFKHWEYDNHSFFDYLLEHQTEKGYFFELIKQMDDRHWSFVDEECRKLFPEDNQSMVRLELEADIEYLMVLYAKMVYQVDGDSEYIRRILPKLEKGIDYMTSEPKRWNVELGLVVRPYTIDTWDFTNDQASQNDRRIHEDQLCAMHGDNSGVYAAMTVLAEFNMMLGNTEKAFKWQERAENLRRSIFAHLWNGRFFAHQFPVSCKPLDDKENERLSLSNVYDINRGVTSYVQSCSIIEEYKRRAKTTDAFCEFFTIDPPYAMFKGYPAGKYVNGAISPFTAGELALASFQNGYEEYGYDILKRFLEMWKQDGGIYFLYARTGGPVSTGSGPSGWGAAALLKAVEEGLAGIKDLSCKFGMLGFAPRWAVTEYTCLRYITGYEKSHIHVDVRHERTDERMLYEIHTPSEQINAHILLPKGKSCKSVEVDGSSVSYLISKVGQSVYADFIITVVKGKTEIIISLQ